MTDAWATGPLALSLTLAAVPAAAATPPPVTDVVAAERAFAADGASRGWVAAFKAHVAPGGMMATPKLQAAETFLAGQPEAAGPILSWWPMWAGIAASGDLGFTTGPYRVGGQQTGYYFTVWRRQPDGGWKWLFDGGPQSSQDAAFAAGRDPLVLPPAGGGSRSSEAALAEVARLERRLSAAATSDSKAAYAPHLGADTRLMGSPAGPAIGPEAIRAELDRRPSSLVLTPRGAEASQAGDLVFTYGEANGAKDGKNLAGAYARIWQYRPEGWRLVFDECLMSPVA